LHVSAPADVPCVTTEHFWLHPHPVWQTGSQILPVSGEQPATGVKHDAQNPFGQAPLWHSLASAHAPPVDLRPQRPFAQTAGARQSASAAQLALQAVAPQRNGPQSVAGAEMQLPAPSHVAPGMYVEPPAGQLGAWQVVPRAYSWQAPAPSHRPSAPQLATEVLEQMLLGSGVPVGTAVHVPRLLGSAHDTHGPAHAVAQQTPCAQVPDAHSVPAEQYAPLFFSPQELPLQMLGAKHWALSVHAPKQRVPLHE
jgi:hypothetical protein